MRKVLLGVFAAMCLVGCGDPTSEMARTPELIEACAKGCHLDSRMLKWTPKEGCVCDTTQPKSAQ